MIKFPEKFLFWILEVNAQEKSCFSALQPVALLLKLFNSSEKNQLGGPHKHLRFSVDFCNPVLHLLLLSIIECAFSLLSGRRDWKSENCLWLRTQR